ncbi:MAG TPA: ribonuclease H-like domain-containing protein [Deltaproteobacteria bacterium]|nr:ribonuclease H-like domain-containing protein [Deltaproteobacteria bacterium]HQI82701.1 ribonuclease H-like domain-containing protein [Deltaproteobacteria bacterium]
MSLRDRLGRLTGEGTQPGRSDPPGELISELRRRIEEVVNRRPVPGPQAHSGRDRTGIPLERLVTGEEVRTPRGGLFFSRSVLAGSHRHGVFRVGDLGHIDMRSAALLAGSDEIAAFEPGHALFLDTETTGLAGGTGTFPFLIGLGWFEGDSFVTTQLFARDFSEEIPMLCLLDELARDRRFLVTFNGRAFDLNLLSARFVLNRMEDTLSNMPHLDLLHPGRRLLRHRMDNARLTTIEACVLGLTRDDDVPGYEIPRRYFDWLRSRDGSLMEDVFRHNRLDIVSMAALLKHLADLVAGGPGRESAHPGDVLCAARLHEERGDTQTALSMYERIAGSPDSRVAISALRACSLIYKKASRWEDAVLIWEGMISRDPLDLFAAEELAKFCEHRRGEFKRAALIVKTVLEGSRTLSPEERSSLEHRLNRLARKSSAP